MKSTFQMIAAAVCAIVLVACGGGGGGSPSSNTPTGVQPPTALKVEDQVVGTGAVAAAGTKASVIYTGYLFDGTKTDLRGTKFDSNAGGYLFSFVVNANPMEVITGFNNGVAGMKIGGKRIITIPPSLGYGASANGPIPANSTLIFEVELVAVNDATASVQPPATLKIEDQVTGTGAEAVTGKKVSVIYTGYFFDGTRANLRGAKFDSNVGGAQFSFVVNANPMEVIAGFNSGVAGMKVGGKRVVTIPPSLGYGALTNGSIPGNSTIIFEVELVSVN